MSDPGLPPISQHAPAPAWMAPTERRPGAGGVLAAIGIVVGAVLMLAVLAYIASVIGPGSVVLATALALVPLAGLLLAVRWIDRWEPEPRGALWFGFLWGAGVSVVIALIVDLGVRLIGSFEGVAPNEFAAAVVQAPIVEETAKGLGVLILAFAVKRHFDGPVDGIVYAAVIAAGFTFTEDILYFAQEAVEGGPEGLAAIFVLRGLISPFAHMLFTACTGFAVGWAIQRTSAPGVVLAWFIGLIPATALHALWNGAAFFVQDFFGYFLAVQVPLFLLAIGIVVMLRRQEARVTRLRLQEYADAGWFAHPEVQWLATPGGRRQARRWARTQSGGKAAVMNRFIADATALAFARQRVVMGRASISAPADERALLEAVTADRVALLA